MTCSARCSGSRAGARGALLLLALAAAACGHAGAAGGEAAPGASSAAVGAGPAARTPDAAAPQAPVRRRIVVLPVENLTGADLPAKQLEAELIRALSHRFEVLGGDALEPFLARHRLRYTGGIDGQAARAIREELGADGVLITTVEVYRTAGPPELGISMRLVDTSDEPVILWMDQAARAGDESPGLLGLGLIDSLPPIEEQLVRRLVASLERALDGGKAPEGCGGGGRYRPRVRARSPMLDRDERYTVAVIPFFDLTPRRGAGEIVSLELVRQLVATGRYRVIEPGVVRSFLLERRIIMPGGVSLEATRLLLGALGVQLVASGTVFDFTENEGARGPTLRFSTVLLDGGTGEVVWHSTSFNRGDDGVWAFGLGRVATPGKLSCRMVSGVVDQLTHGKTGPVPEIARWYDPVRESLQREHGEGRGHGK